ncbi:MAG: tetratricopeptide repeat protein [Crocosphaera sp.]
MLKNSDLTVGFADNLLGLRLRQHEIMKYHLDSNKNKTSWQGLKPSQEALQVYNRSIETYSNNPWAFVHRGILYKNENQFDLALKDFNQALNLNSRYGLAYQHRGQLYYKEAEVHKNLALKDFNQAIELNAKDSSTLFHRGILHALSGNLFQALEDFTKVIKLNPNESALYNRGVIFYQQNQIELAGEDFKNALTMNRKHCPSLINLGLILYELGPIQPAMQLFQEAVSLTKEPEGKLALAVSRFRENQDNESKLLLDDFNKELLNLSYLKDQLWGPKLIRDTDNFLRFKLQSLKITDCDDYEQQN